MRAVARAVARVARTATRGRRARAMPARADASTAPSRVRAMPRRGRDVRAVESAKEAAATRAGRRRGDARGAGEARRSARRARARASSRARRRRTARRRAWRSWAGGWGARRWRLALTQRGVRATVYERDERFEARKQGYGLTMQKYSGGAALRALGIGVARRGERRAREHGRERARVGRIRTQRSTTRRRRGGRGRRRARWWCRRGGGER